MHYKALGSMAFCIRPQGRSNFKEPLGLKNNQKKTNMFSLIKCNKKKQGKKKESQKQLLIKSTIIA